MPRRPLTCTNQFPYHVTSRSNNREWFYLPIEKVWQISCAAVFSVSEKYRVNTYSFVLLSNHFHWMLETPMNNLGDVMRDFLTQVSKDIQRHSGRINHIFGARYKWSILDSPYSVAYVQKYILRNPVRAGLSDLVESYRFSSLTNGDALPMASGVGSLWTAVPKRKSDLLAWLNAPTAKDLETQIAKALRKEFFKFSTDNVNQKAIRALRGSYAIEPPDRFFSSLMGD